MIKPNENKTKPINRLILVGNGFDLAHGIKTSYRHFIIGYFEKCWEKAKSEYTSSNENSVKVYYKDELISISISPSIHQNLPIDIDFNNNKTLKNIISNEIIPSSPKAIYFGVSSSFLRSLINLMIDKNWVDIENFYYQELIKIINPIKNHLNPRGDIKLEDLKKLNNDFGLIKNKLEKYLSALEKSHEIYGLKDLIYDTEVFGHSNLHTKVELKNVMILNFNYTNTTQKYKMPNTDIVHIHGEVDNQSNPIIFGYGDERDESYEKLEKSKVEGVFTHIKSFDYFKTDNYSRLLAFLESEFDVYIMGHSCGLSDRTLLSTIFEHKNCRFIKVFYYDNPENYRKTTYEISRHFTDKAGMRKKVLDITKCKPMPQLKQDQ